MINLEKFPQSIKDGLNNDCYFYVHHYVDSWECGYYHCINIKHDTLDVALENLKQYLQKFKIVF